MHPIICSLAGLVGMSLCLWVLGDVFRVIVLDCMLLTYKTKQRVLTSHWAEAHTKMMMRAESIDVELEELQEVFIETVEPFVE